VPARGEWVEITPFNDGEDRVLPEQLPRRGKGTGEWSLRTKQMYAAMREDPVTKQYLSSDICFAVDTMYLYEMWVRGGKGKAGYSREFRIRMDNLGLSAKGRQYLRWRYAPEPVEEPPSVVPLRRLRLSAEDR
jgi:hypothetical protein